MKMWKNGSSLGAQFRLRQKCAVKLADFVVQLFGTHKNSGKKLDPSHFAVTVYTTYTDGQVEGRSETFQPRVCR